jgi:hypothetical protein
MRLRGVATAGCRLSFRVRGQKVDEEIANEQPHLPDQTTSRGVQMLNESDVRA